MNMHHVFRARLAELPLLPILASEDSDYTIPCTYAVIYCERCGTDKSYNPCIGCSPDLEPNTIMQLFMYYACGPVGLVLRHNERMLFHIGNKVTKP